MENDSLERLKILEGLLVEARDTVQASTVEHGISDSRREYRVRLYERLNAALPPKKPDPRRCWREGCPNKGKLMNSWIERPYVRYACEPGDVKCDSTYSLRIIDDPVTDPGVQQALEEVSKTKSPMTCVLRPSSLESAATTAVEKLKEADKIVNDFFERPGSKIQRVSDLISLTLDLLQSKMTSSQ